MSNYIVRTMADGTSVSSNATETLSSSYLISANTVAVGSFLQMYARVDRSVDNAVTYTVKIYANTSAALAGATLLAQYTTSAAQDNVDMGRWFIVKSSTVTQVIDSAQSTVTRFVVPTGSFTEANIDWTVDQYFIISLTNNGSGQTVLAKGMLILKY